MKSSYTLAVLILQLMMAALVVAAPEPAVDLMIVRKEGKPFEATLTLQLKNQGSGTVVTSKPLDARQSAAAKATSAWEVTGADGKPVSVVEVSTPGGKSPANQISASLAREDAGKGPFVVRVKSVDGNPALRLTTGETFSALEFKDVNDTSIPALVSFTTPIKPTLSIGGGKDGALLGFQYHWADFDVTDFHVLHYSILLEGSVTPNPDKASALYGKYSAQADALFAAGIPAGLPVNGEFFIGPNVRFESDQRANNYDGSVGLSTWWFINSRWLARIANGLIANPGEKSDAGLAIYLGYDHVVTSEYDAKAVAQGDERLRGRLIWSLRLLENSQLGILPTEYDVTLRFDVGGVFDMNHSKFQRDLRVTLEFMPPKGQEKLGFSVGYVNGKISPTFADENTFIAGLLYRF